jgi:phosphatase NudJ
MIPTCLVVLVVVAHEGRYLVVEERDGTFYLPAGKVEPGENLMAAAIRETAEEAGTAIDLRGILGLDHDWGVMRGAVAMNRTGDASPRRSKRGGCRPTRLKMRFVFVGYPAVLSPPKTVADLHSRSACWLTKREIRARPLRHPEVLRWIDLYESGRCLLPCAANEVGSAP